MLIQDPRGFKTVGVCFYSCHLDKATVFAPPNREAMSGITLPKISLFVLHQIIRNRPVNLPHGIITQVFNFDPAYFTGFKR